MTVGVGHRSLEAAPPEEDFATVLKEADGAFLANQNFHDVEARMTLAPDLPYPSARHPAQSLLFPSIDGPIPFPADFRRPRLHLDEDQHVALEDDEVELVAGMPPVRRQDAPPLPTIMGGGDLLAPGTEFGRRGAKPTPSPERPPEFGEKHGG